MVHKKYIVNIKQQFLLLSNIEFSSCLEAVEKVSKTEELSVKAVQCSLCKYLVGYVDKVLGNNKSSAAVEAALDKACNVLPSVVRTECTTFAHKYAPLIAILIAKNATPEEVCDFLKVCHNGTQEINSKYKIAVLCFLIIDFLVFRSC
jgi:hypothetical protein